MATTARSALRKALSENMGDWHEDTGETNSTKANIVDKGLLALPGGGDDDFCLGFYVMDPGADEIRRVKTYTASTNTIVCEDDFTTAITAGTTYELHRFDPLWKHAAINQAIEEVYPFLYLALVDETLVVDDILLNSDFENGTFTSWTTVGSPTLTSEATIVFHGAKSAKIVSSGSAVGQLTQTPTINTEEITGKAVKFWAWVYATAADTARIRLDFDGTTIENSEFHSGKDQWELLKVETSVIDGATNPVKAIVESAISGTSYFDSSRLRVGTLLRHTIPTSLLELRYVLQQSREENEVDFQPIRRGGLHAAGLPEPFRRLRLEGMAPLSRVTSESGTTEVGGIQTRLILAWAEYYLWRTIAQRGSAEDRRRYQEDAQSARDYAIYLQGQPGVRTAPMGAQDRAGIWHQEEDASGRYLIFDARASSFSLRSMV